MVCGRAHISSPDQQTLGSRHWPCALDCRHQHIICASFVYVWSRCVCAHYSICALRKHKRAPFSTLHIHMHMHNHHTHLHTASFLTGNACNPPKHTVPVWSVLWYWSLQFENALALWTGLGTHTHTHKSVGPHDSRSLRSALHTSNTDRLHNNLAPNFTCPRVSRVLAAYFGRVRVRVKAKIYIIEFHSARYTLSDNYQTTILACAARDSSFARCWQIYW